MDDPDASFLRLRARHAERLNPTHIGERLVLADAAIDLGRRTGVDEYVVRHEALLLRMEVRDLDRVAVAAAG